MILPVYYLDGYHILNHQVLDLTADIPTSGAYWLVVDVDTAGVLSTRISADFFNKNALEYEDIPDIIDGQLTILALKVYAGQTRFIKDPTDLDIIELPHFTTYRKTEVDEILANHFEPVTGTVERKAQGFFIDGSLAVLTNVCSFLATTNFDIARVTIRGVTLGTSDDTKIDVNLNGVTMFTTQSNRPTLLYNDSDSVASGVPDLVQVSIGDIITIDIDEIATGSIGLEIIIVEEIQEVVFADGEIVMAFVAND